MTPTFTRIDLAVVLIYLAARINRVGRYAGDGGRPSPFPSPFGRG
jgi:hypothetical protein